MAKKQHQRSTKKPKLPLICTDKWRLHPSLQDKKLLELTVAQYKRLVRALIGVVHTHWVEVAEAKDQIKAVESLIHATNKHPRVKYAYFGRALYKFLSYLRRAAIDNAIGQVSSLVTRYQAWHSGVRNRRDAKPPKLTADAGFVPRLYQGQCFLFGARLDTDQIKVFTGTDWIGSQPMPVNGFRERHKIASNQRKSPQLIVSSGKCHLSQPFQVNLTAIAETNRVLSVDLGINTTATIALVTSSSTVMPREFLHLGKDIHRRDQRLKRISPKAKLTGKLDKRFCRGLYRKANHINQEIAQRVHL